MKTYTIQGPNTELKINTAEIEHLYSILKSINHEFRKKLLHILHTQGVLSVSELLIHCRSSQSYVSHHLAILRSAKLVKSERKGKFIYYTLNAKRMQQLQGFFNELFSAKK